MNIFYLSHNVEDCAAQHIDKHAVKMILEYAQLLSTAHRMLDGSIYIDSSSGRKIKRWKHENVKFENLLFKASHINHPSAIWTRADKNNYEWLSNLLVALCKEYTHRYHKIHSVEKSGLMVMLKTPPKNIKELKFTPPPPAMPDKYKTSESISSYRNYYCGDKKTFAVWTNRKIPDWFEKNVPGSLVSTTDLKKLSVKNYIIPF